MCERDAIICVREALNVCERVVVCVRERDSDFMCVAIPKRTAVSVLAVESPSPAVMMTQILQR